MGKALLEKLLRCCPKVSKIYILLRNKRNKNSKQRLDELFQNPVFTKLRSEQPDALQKIVPISGDCCQLQLSISSEDLAKLHNVNIIYHAAASVR